MLFSEPKIPQLIPSPIGFQRFSFSALQRAENSSIKARRNDVQRAEEFQCSSASRKFLNAHRMARNSNANDGFSALQRAENSSMEEQKRDAERKVERFSALQRAENSSISVSHSAPVASTSGFSALQRAENSSIVQIRRRRDDRIEFQCSSASRKFLNNDPALVARQRYRFQCSSASRKFLNIAGTPRTPRAQSSFSALQRAENSSILFRAGGDNHSVTGFSALQRAENSSILRPSLDLDKRAKFQCSSASRKFLNFETDPNGTIYGPRFSALQRAENSSMKTIRTLFWR